MAYPGNVELSADAQERVMTAFRQVVTKLQDGQREEAMIGLEFVLRLDPGFAPAVNLQRQLSSGAAEIDLSEIIAQLHAPTTDMINELLVEAVDDFNQRYFLDAKEKVERVLLELPGHQEARHLLVQLQESLKVETQVGQFLAQAREALDQGDPQEAANFVMMAQALDPHHHGISATLQEIRAASGDLAALTSLAQEPQPVEAVDDFGVSFAPLDGPPQDHGAGEGFPPLTSPQPMAGAGGSPFASSPGGFSFAAEEAPADASSFAAVEPHDLSGPVSPQDDFFVPEGLQAETGESDLPSTADDREWSAESLGEFSFGPDEAGLPDSAASPQRDDISELFAAEEAAWSPAEEPVAPSEGPRPEDAQRIQHALELGTAAFDRGDYQEAIDIWSRIYLLDPNHEEVPRRIDEAHRRKEEIDRQVEHIFYEAQDAALSGEVDRALELVDQILALQPGHLEAIQLKERLAGPPPAEPTSAPEPALPPPDLDDDLFSEPAEAIVAGTAPAPSPTAVARRQLPWLPIALGVGGLVVILLGVWFGSQMLSPRGSDDDGGATVSRVLAQGETLFAQGRIEEAIHLYQELLQTIPAADLDRDRIERRIEHFQRTLTPPTPTPSPEALPVAEQLLAQGRWLSAYAQVVQGLQTQPQSTQLLALKDSILQQKPLIAPLYAAAQKGDFATAVAVAEDLLERDPAQTEVANELGRYLFNAAVLELRAYNLTAAEGYLAQLTRLHPGDDEADRVLRFTEKYKTRPVDLQLNTFIKSLSLR